MTAEPCEISDTRGRGLCKCSVGGGGEGAVGPYSKAKNAQPEEVVLASEVRKRESCPDAMAKAWRSEGTDMERRSHEGKGWAGDEQERLGCG